MELTTGPNMSLTKECGIENAHHISAAVLRGSQLITSGAVGGERESKIDRERTNR